MKYQFFFLFIFLGSNISGGVSGPQVSLSGPGPVHLANSFSINHKGGQLEDIEVNVEGIFFLFFEFMHIFPFFCNLNCSILIILITLISMVLCLSFKKVLLHPRFCVL
jgi:hypothetical protein